MIQTIVSYLNERLATLGRIDHRYCLVEIRKRDGDEAAIPYEYRGNGEFAAVDIDNGSCSYWRGRSGFTLEPVSVFGRATKQQAASYPLRLVVLHRRKDSTADDTFMPSRLAEDVANILNFDNGDLQTMLGAWSVSCRASGGEYDSTKVWSEEFKTSISDLDYKLCMISIDITVDVVADYACWEGECETDPDILHLFNFCDNSVIARLTDEQVTCLQSAICTPTPCDPATWTLLQEISGNTISTGSIDSGDSENIFAPKATVLRDGLPYGFVDSGATIDVPSSVPYPSTWVVNPDWDTLPTPAANEFFGLFLVFENGYNRAVLTTNSGSTIDWGDGSSVASSGSLQSHVYDYSTLVGTVNVCPWSGRNYKQVVVEVSGGTITSFDMSNTSSQPINVQQGWADIYANVPSCTTFAIGTTATNAKLGFLERVRITDSASGCTFSNLLTYVPNVQYLELPWTKIGTATNILFFGGRDLVIPDLTIATLPNSSLSGCNVMSMGDLTVTSSFGTRMFLNSTIRKIGTIAVPASTSKLQNMFEGCRSLVSPIVVDASGVTVLLNFADDCSAPSITIVDASSVTTTTNAFNGANISDGVILNGIRVGFSVAGTNLSVYGAGLMAASLGTASGAQTITITNTPFGQAVIALDATALTHAATITGKGYTIAN